MSQIFFMSLLILPYLLTNIFMFSFHFINSYGTPCLYSTRTSFTADIIYVLFLYRIIFKATTHRNVAQVETKILQNVELTCSFSGMRTHKPFQQLYEWHMKFKREVPSLTGGAISDWAHTAKRQDSNPEIEQMIRKNRASNYG